MAETPSEQLTLSAAQRRVLGVLIEKSFTTPEQYPLSLNAIVTACNQKTNRHPVVDFSEGDVSAVVQELKHKGLVTTAEARAGSRVYRYQHVVASKLGWSPRESAVMTELLLRGPQTAGELRSRADRMVKMQNLEFVQGILHELATVEPPLVRALPREPGRSAERFAHTLHTDGEAVSSVVPSVAESSGPSVAARLQSLESRLATLEAAVARLTGSAEEQP